MEKVSYNQEVKVPASPSDRDEVVHIFPSNIGRKVL